MITDCFNLDSFPTKHQAREDRLIAQREAEWQGRAEGFDHSRAVHSSQDVDALRDSIRMKKKNAQRGDLPPLSDVSNNMVR